MPTLRQKLGDIAVTSFKTIMDHPEKPADNLDGPP